MPLPRPVTALALLALLTARPLAAQLAPLTVPKGLLRLEFGGRFDNWDQRYFNGVKESAAGDFIRDPADGRWLPGLASAEQKLRDVSGVTTLSLSLGKTSSTMLVNVETGSIGAAYGLTRRLTVFGNVPIVRVRVQPKFGLDSTDATAGFNPADPTFGSVAGAQTVSFLSQLQAALGTLQARLTAGFYDASPSQKALAIATLSQGTTLQEQLQSLFGSETFLPITGTTAARAVATPIESLRTALTSVNITTLLASPAFPTRGIGGAEFQDYATNKKGPIQARPFTPPVLQYLGDIEVGAAYSWLEHRLAKGGIEIRSTLVGTVRLRTGKLDRADSFFDLSTGDRQPDVQGDLVSDFSSGRFGARVTARYVLQLPGRLQRRVSAPDLPIAPATTLAAVERDPGEIIEGSVEPFVRIAPTLALFGGVRYWSKAHDTYRYVANQEPIAGTALEVLALGSQEHGTAFSAGMSFAHDGLGREGVRGLPMDASLRWELVGRSTLGRVPAKQSVSVMLRFYRKMF
jgi:hypothetical protein